MELFIAILVGVSTFYFIAFHKKIVSVIDPLFFTVATSACASAVPIFLYVTGYMKERYFVYIALSELFFWLPSIAMCMVRRNRPHFDWNRQRLNKRDEESLFYVCLFMVLAIKMLCYAIGGIPLFAESRFTARQNVLVASIERLLVFPMMYCWIYSYYTILKRKQLAKGFSVFMLLIIISALSGSKGFILGATFAFFFYSYYFKFKLPKLKLKYVLPILLSPLLVISIYYSTNGFWSGMGLLIYRFVAAGDGYWQGFSNDVIEHINNTAAWYERTFSFILGPLKLVSPNAKIPIGTLILNVINPGTEGTIEGANSRIPIFTYVCYGWPGIIISFILGLLFYKIVFLGKISLPYGVSYATFMGIIFMLGLKIPSDPTMFFSGIIDLLAAIIMYNTYVYVFCSGRAMFRLY